MKAEASKLIASHVGKTNGNGRSAEMAELRTERDKLQVELAELRIELDYQRVPAELWKDMILFCHPDRHLSRLRSRILD